MVMFGMLTKWERKILLDKLHGVEVNPDHLRAVKHRAKKRLIQAMRDLHLLLAVFPDLAVTGVTGWCGGWDLNPRTPTGQEPQSCAFDQAWLPPPVMCFLVPGI